VIAFSQLAESVSENISDLADHLVANRTTTDHHQESAKNSGNVIKRTVYDHCFNNQSRYCSALIELVICNFAKTFVELAEILFIYI